VWVERTYDDWKLPFDLQNSADLRGGLANPLSTILDAARALGDRDWSEGLHLPWVIGFLVLLVVVFRRLPLAYGAYSGALLLVALTGHTLGSFERYGLAAFPLVIGLAIVIRGSVLERTGIAAAAAGLTAFTTLIFLGAFVP
jgi:hypothetical protein